MSFFSRVSKSSSLLNSTEKEIINYILKNKTEVKDKKIRVLANALFISPNTIMRLCKKLGYSGYSELKYELLQEEVSNNISTKKEIVIYEENEIINKLKKTISLNSEETITEIVNKIMENKIIYFYGLGLSKYSILSFSKKLHYLGKVCIFPDDRDSANIIFKGLDHNDLLILVSCSGEHKDLQEFVYIAKTNNAKLLTITSLSQNPLVELADCSLFTYIDTKSINGGDCSSRIGFEFIFDILFENILLNYK